MKLSTMMKKAIDFFEKNKPEGVFIRGHICARYVLPDGDEFQAANGATFDTVTESWIN